MANDQITTLLAGNGFRRGFTPIPNELLDFLFPWLGEAERRVVIYVCRRTFGFSKGQDHISLKQICEGLVMRSGSQLDSGTGMSKPAVIQAIRSLGEKGVLLSSDPTRRGRGAVKKYAVALTGWARELVDDKVNQLDPSRRTHKGQLASRRSGNLENPLTPIRVTPLNTQQKDTSGKIGYSRDDIRSRQTYNQRQNQTDSGLRRNDPYTYYDKSSEFNQVESTYWRPDPGADDEADN